MMFQDSRKMRILFFVMIAFTIVLLLWNSYQIREKRQEIKDDPCNTCEDYYNKRCIEPPKLPESMPSEQKQEIWNSWLNKSSDNTIMI